MISLTNNSKKKKFNEKVRIKVIIFVYVVMRDIIRYDKTFFIHLFFSRPK
jgi:hypothetical protein